MDYLCQSIHHFDMKTWLVILMVLVVFFQSCDEVEPPYTEANQSPEVADSAIQKVVIEEFTGHLCPNCPEGAKVAHQLEQMYPDRVIIVSIHAGYFANLQSPNYLTDYRCSTGDDLFNVFQPISYPTAMINRISRNGSPLLEKDAWAPLVDSLIHTSPTIRISYEKQYNSTTSTLQATIHFIFLQNIEEKTMWCAFITEDSLISYQKNNNSSLGPVPDIADYQHNNVLRGSVNGSWGDTLSIDPVQAGDTISKTFQYSFASSPWNINNTHIVVFAYESTTKRILQVNKFPVK